MMEKWGDWVNSTESRFGSMTKENLLKAIQDCDSLSQLFALVENQNIQLQMHTCAEASGLTPRVLVQKRIEEKTDLPFLRLKAEVSTAVERASKIGLHSQPSAEVISQKGKELPYLILPKPKSLSAQSQSLINRLDRCNAVGEVFEFVKQHNIAVQMHAQTGASNIQKNVLKTKVNVGSVAPVAKLKNEIRKAIEQNDTPYKPPILSPDEVAESVDRLESVSEVLDFAREQEIKLPIFSDSVHPPINSETEDSSAKATSTPFEKLKDVVKSVVKNEELQAQKTRIEAENLKAHLEETERKRRLLLSELDKCTTLGQVIDFIKDKNIKIEMFSKPDISYLYHQANTPKDLLNKEYTPFGKLKTIVQKEIENMYKNRD